MRFFQRLAMPARPPWLGSPEAAGGASPDGASSEASSDFGTVEEDDQVEGQPAPAQASEGNSGNVRMLLKDLIVWIESQACLRANVSWRTILKSHLQRPKHLGGPICFQNIADLVRCQRLTEDSVEAVLAIPDSWEPGDGARCGGYAVAQNEEEATVGACKDIMMSLLLRDARVNYPASKLRLVPNNWKIPPSNLQRKIAEFAGYVVSQNDESAESQSAAMHAPGKSRRSWAAYVQPAAHEVEARNAEIANLLVAISANEVDDENKEGWGRPSYSKPLWVQKAGRWAKLKPWQELMRLLKPGTLLKFLRDRPHMFEVRVDGRGKIDSFRSTIAEAPDPAALAELAAYLAEPEQPAAQTSSDEPYQTPLADAPTSMSGQDDTAAVQDRTAQRGVPPAVDALLTIQENFQSGDVGSSAIVMANAYAQRWGRHAEEVNQASQPRRLPPRAEPVEGAPSQVAENSQSDDVGERHMRPRSCHCGTCLPEYLQAGWTCHGPAQPGAF
jgi:hypothetical protein